MLTPYKLGLVASIIFIIVLFLMPIIFYYSLNDSPPDSSPRFVNISQSQLLMECGVIVEESNCTRDLTNVYNALGLTSLFEDSFCISKTKHLFCQALSSCDNQSHIEDIVCQDVRQEYCTAEWRILELQGSEGLIDCDVYGETARLTCSDQFSVDDSGVACLPLCKEFSQNGDSNTIAVIVMSGIAYIANTIGGIFVLIVSFWRREKIFHFPQVLIVINAGIMTFLSLYLAIPSAAFGSWRPLCTDKFLTDVLMDSTAYCQISGFVATSTVVLYCAFWCLYIFHLLLKLVFPIWSKVVYNSVHSIKIHIIEVTCVFIVGTVPYIVFASASKNRIGSFPPRGCSGDAVYSFYSLVVPTVILSCSSLVMMLVILYNIHIQQGIFKRRLNKSTGKPIRTFHFSTPEVKLFFMFCYLLVIMIMVWTSFSIRDGSANSFRFYLEQYWRCMSGGTGRSDTCEPYRREFESLSHPGLECTYLILLAFLNLSSLPFVIQYKTIKRSVREATRRITLKKSSDSDKKNSDSDKKSSDIDMNSKV
ncbi:uncharacterized protein [Dysidea avara]